MNNGIWGTVIDKTKLFYFAPKVPSFLDTSFEYYVQLDYYISKGGILEFKFYNDKKIKNDSINIDLINKGGILIKKLKKLDNPFIFYLIYGTNCDDIVLKNMEIFYFIEDIEKKLIVNNEECNLNESECKIIKSISAIGDGITVESGGQLIVGS